jgi:hypothetical protein
VAGIIGWIDEPSLEMTNTVMKEADIILATGGPGNGQVGVLLRQTRRRRGVGGWVGFFLLTLTELVYLGEAKIGGLAPDLSMEGAAFRLKKI